MESPQTDISLIKQLYDAIKTQYAQNIAGQEDLLQKIFICIIANGHLLLEGVPGLGKTRAVKTIAGAMNVNFKRIQFTPDLLPSDVIGSQIYDQRKAEFITKLGPVFGNLILADEINRAPAKVQSALLEAMQERQVTIGEQSYKLPELFFVMATQNPIEQEGTYNLPEAQIDRFMMKLEVKYPSAADEIQVLKLFGADNSLKVAPAVTPEQIKTAQQLAAKVFIHDRLLQYIYNLVAATRDPKAYNIPELENKISFGASPRASLAFLQASKVLAALSGRGNVIPEDIKALAHDILRHRLIIDFEAEAEGLTANSAIDIILTKITVP